jgi:hypothetical protein
MQEEAKNEKINSLCIPFHTSVSVLFHHSTKFQMDTHYPNKHQHQYFNVHELIIALCVSFVPVTTLFL